MKQQEEILKRRIFPQVVFVFGLFHLRVDKYCLGFGIEGDFKSTPPVVMCNTRGTVLLLPSISITRAVYSSIKVLLCLCLSVNQVCRRLTS